MKFIEMVTLMHGDRRNSMKAKKHRILLIDPHSLFREGLTRILEMEETFQIIAEGDNGEQLLSLYTQHLPDIVLMDINFPQKNGLEALRELINLIPDATVLIFTDITDTKYVFQALDEGAAGYLLKEMNASSLIDTVKEVLKGGFYLHPKVTGAFLSELLNRKSTENLRINYHQLDVKAPFHLLTRREAEVLQLLSEGHSNYSLGLVLKITEKTVKNHVSSLLKKLNVNDRTQAVLIGLKNGWIELK